MTQKARPYSENRIKYPMKRVDFDPNGNRNQQNQGQVWLRPDQLG